MIWEPNTFEVAYFTGPSMVAGYVYRGLGMWIAIQGSPKGKRPPTWSLQHLGSGHRLCLIDGTVAKAFPVATEIAQAGEWDFLSLEGWKDRFPDAPERLREILARHKNTSGVGVAAHTDRGLAIAQQIAANRP